MKVSSFILGSYGSIRYKLNSILGYSLFTMVFSRTNAYYGCEKVTFMSKPNRKQGFLNKFLINSFAETENHPTKLLILEIPQSAV